MLSIENVVELTSTPKQRNEFSFVVEQAAAFNPPPEGASLGMGMQLRQC